MNKISKNIFLIGALFSLIMLTNCKKDKKDNSAAALVAILGSSTSTSTSTTSCKVTGTESLTGTISSNKTLACTKNWLLDGTVTVSSGVTLTIDAGTTVYGSSTNSGALVIKQGAKIEAVGTALKPIIFTSEKAVGSRASGDWQGIIIQGNGCQTFGTRCSAATGEGDVGTFGGSDNTDNSGTLKYVRIEFAGKAFSPGNERNCLSLQGVGSGTTIDYIQCHKGYDDGIEWWGGAVNVTHAISSGNRDDQFDYTDGYLGKVQYAIGHLFATQISLNDDTSRCIEGDGNAKGSCTSSATNSTGDCSEPSFANVTCVGTGATTTNHGAAIFVRRGVTGVTLGNFGNFLVDQFKASSEGSKSADCSKNSGNAYFYGIYASSNVTDKNLNSCTGSTSNVSVAPITGVGITSNSETTPNYAPSGGSAPSLSLKTVYGFTSGIESASFYGALDGTTDWTTGWASFPEN